LEVIETWLCFNEYVNCLFARRVTATNQRLTWYNDNYEGSHYLMLNERLFLFPHKTIKLKPIAKPFYPAIAGQVLLVHAKAMTTCCVNMQLGRVFGVNLFLV